MFAAYAAVAQGLQEIPRDNDFWATYLKEARKELQDLFATNSNDNTKLRHLLSSDSQVDASTLDLALKVSDTDTHTFILNSLICLFPLEKHNLLSQLNILFNQSITFAIIFKSRAGS